MASCLCHQPPVDLQRIKHPTDPTLFLPLLLHALPHLSILRVLYPFPVHSNPEAEAKVFMHVCMVVCMVSMYMYGGVVVHASVCACMYVYDVYGLWGCVRMHVCVHACVYGKYVMCMVCGVCA